MAESKHPANTIPDGTWRSLQDRAVQHENRNGGSVSGAAAQRRRAHDPKKAGSN